MACPLLAAQIYRCSLKKQTGVSLQYMMAHGACPSDRSLLQAAQFLQQELPIRLAHRVTELENLPFGLSTKAPVLKVALLVPGPSPTGPGGRLRDLLSCLPACRRLALCAVWQPAAA